MKTLVKFFGITLLLILCLTTAKAQRLTGVYLNTQELNPQQLYALQMYTGILRQGAYYVDYQGNFGLMGYYPAFNLYERIAAIENHQRQNGNTQSNEYYRKEDSEAGRIRATGQYTWKEGSSSGWSNPRTGNSIISDGGKVAGLWSNGKYIELPGN